RHEGIHIVETLARENPFVEEILIRIRHRGGIGVDAGVARINASEERARRARQGDADSWLENAVALRDSATLRIDHRAIQRMADDADELSGGITRKPRVRVE